MTKKFNTKWFVILGAVLIQICIGSIYSWSLFNQPLIDKFSWSKTDVVFTFSLLIFTFAFTTIFSGRLQDKIGPKKVSFIGGVIYGMGLILTSTATSIAQLYLYYGIIAGIGIGFCYVCPLTTCIKWFPNKKGLVTGITVGSFGLGSLIFQSVIQYFLSSKGVSQTFFYIGLLYLSLILIGSQFLKIPPNDYSKIIEKENLASKEIHYTVSEMMKTKSFPLLWIIYLLGTMSGLLVIGMAKDIGVQLVNLTPTTAANIVSIIALFNASGRLVWGTLSDKIGRIKVLLTLLVITSLSMFYMTFISLNLLSFFIVVGSIAFCFGGLLSVFPAITSDLYGIKNLGSNYGVIYQAYGISALLGPIISSNTSNITTTFLIAGIASSICIFLTHLVKSKINIAK